MSKKSSTRQPNQLREQTRVEESPYNVQSILLAPSDSDYLDHLITAITDASATNREDLLLDELAQFADDREAEIERMCNNNHQDFVSSVNQLLSVRKGTYDLTSEILRLNQTIQASTEKLVEQKKALVDSRDVRSNIDEAGRGLRMCLEVLRLANRVRELLASKSHYPALRTLDELQNVHLKEVLQFNLAEVIQQSVPAMQRMIKDAVMSDLNAWLYRIRETSQLLGQVAFDQTELRRRRQRERIEKLPYLRPFKLNSAIELVLDECEEFNILDNEEVRVDFTPLFECLHIYDALGERDEFRLAYADTRQQQKELLMNITTLEFRDDDISALANLLEQIAGFAIVERATIRKTANFRSSSDVDGLWDSMVKKAIAVMTPAVMNGVQNSATLLKIKNILALFIQTMDGWDYNVDALDDFLLTLFNKYSELLKAKFTADFKEIVNNDDYMPMAIENEQQYDEIVNICWYKTERKGKESLQFPCVLPFSQMYPHCCINIRDFLNRYYYFSDEYFQQQSIIDNTLKDAIDELLVNQVCKSLVERLESKYLGQIVQILINLEQFEHACEELEKLLAETRGPRGTGATVITTPTTTAAGGPSTSLSPSSLSSTDVKTITLTATSTFRAEKKTAEKRIFELVNSKIDDLVETAEYDWAAKAETKTPSLYLVEMTRFLSNIMNSTLLGLPRDIKGLIYFDALSHLASSILALPLAEDVQRITPAAVANLDTDVRYLQGFVDGLVATQQQSGNGNGSGGGGMSMLPAIFEELRQTVDLLVKVAKEGEGAAEEFYDVGVRMRKYASVDPMNGPVLVEKVVLGRTQAQPPPPPPTSVGGKLGMSVGGVNVGWGRGGS
ncbi:exocyst complex subunit Sec15-like-domain-containing protein [Peziza echinospora]|nr:exocyst complex subunit Sec15-like-domain-containing protein [Peziza echinospora]